MCTEIDEDDAERTVESRNFTLDCRIHAFGELPRGVVRYGMARGIGDVPAWPTVGGRALQCRSRHVAQCGERLVVRSGDAVVPVLVLHARRAGIALSGVNGDMAGDVVVPSGNPCRHRGALHLIAEKEDDAAAAFAERERGRKFAGDVLRTREAASQQPRKAPRTAAFALQQDDEELAGM